AFQLQVIHALWLMGADAPGGARADYDGGAQDGGGAQADGGAQDRERHARDQGPSAATIADLLGGPATTDDVRAAADRLCGIGLVRSEYDDMPGSTPRYRLGPSTAESLGRFPGGLGP